MLLKHTIMCTSVLALLKKDTKSVYGCQNWPRLSPGYQAIWTSKTVAIMKKD